MPRTLAVAMLALLLAAPALAEAPAAPAIAWGEDLPAALRDARSSTRPVLVDVWAVWCVPCRQMDETTYRDAQVIQALGGVVPLKLNADVQQPFLTTHRVDVFPTILFLDDKGREITRLLGLVSATDLLEVVRAVTDGYAAYRAALDAPESIGTDETLARYLVAVDNPAEAIRRLRRTVKRAEGPERTSIELLLAQARLQDQDFKGAVTDFERLASAGDADVRRQALEGLAAAERGRGREAEAEAALERLRRESASAGG